MGIKETVRVFGDQVSVAGVGKKLKLKSKTKQKQYDVLCTRCASLNSG